MPKNQQRMLTNKKQYASVWQQREISALSQLLLSKFHRHTETLLQWRPTFAHNHGEDLLNDDGLHVLPVCGQPLLELSLLLQERGVWHCSSPLSPNVVTPLGLVLPEVMAASTALRGRWSPASMA